jgi:hypothetical protein
MALTETKIIDKVELDLEYGGIIVRERNLIFKDGAEIAKTYERKSFDPDVDTTTLSPEILAIANATWTTEIVQRFQARKQKIQAENDALALASNQPTN